MSKVPLYGTSVHIQVKPGTCEDQVLEGPASGGKGSKFRNQFDCIRGKGVRALVFRKESCM